jgi:hypothetical protein
LGTETDHWSFKKAFPIRTSYQKVQKIEYLCFKAPEGTWKHRNLQSAKAKALAKRRQSVDKASAKRDQSVGKALESVGKAVAKLEQSAGKA